jgi:hypothetical protein
MVTPHRSSDPKPPRNPLSRLDSDRPPIDPDPSVALRALSHLVALLRRLQERSALASEGPSPTSAS